MICITCGSETDSVKSIVARNRILTGCPNCLQSQLQHGTDTAHKYFKREQQTKFRRELTQPIEPREFIKAYGVDKARERGYNDDTIRKYSS